MSGDSSQPVSDYERRRRRVLWTLPSGLYVVGSRAGDALNAMTLNWAMQVSLQPKQLAISVLNTAYTHKLITHGGVFALSILRREDKALVRKFVKPVTVDYDAETLNGFSFVTKLSGAPVLGAAAAYVDCEVRQSVNVGDHTLFIGEVIDAGFSGDEEFEVLRMEDTRMNYGG